MLKTIEPQAVHTGRVYLGAIDVEMDKIYIFGKHQQLHEMISFMPGFGDGTYEVYGEVKEIAEHGFKITKVEIECISDKEIDYYKSISS